MRTLAPGRNVVAGANGVVCVGVLELVKHEGGQLAAPCFHVGQERRPVLLYGSIKQSRFGTMALVRARGRVGVTARCWLRGKHQQKFSATRKYLLLAKRSFRHSRQSRACGSIGESKLVFERRKTLTGSSMATLSDLESIPARVHPASVDVP